jgi:hypothetical protein
VVKLLKEVKYGIRVGFATVNIDPFLGALSEQQRTQTGFVWSVGNTRVRWTPPLQQQQQQQQQQKAQAREQGPTSDMEVCLPSRVMQGKQVRIHSQAPGAKFRLSLSCDSGNVLRDPAIKAGTVAAVVDQSGVLSFRSPGRLQGEDACCHTLVRD